jgi:hypothetical protein
MIRRHILFPSFCFLPLELSNKERLDLRQGTGSMEQCKNSRDEHPCVQLNPLCEPHPSNTIPHWGRPLQHEALLASLQVRDPCIACLVFPCMACEAWTPCSHDVKCTFAPLYTYCEAYI